jgi:hypothetical protein
MVNMFAYGGNAPAFEYYHTYPSGYAQFTPSLFRIERTPNIRIVQMADQPRITGGHDTIGRGVDPDLWHMLLERTGTGSASDILTQILDRPVLYKRGFK